MKLIRPRSLLIVAVATATVSGCSSAGNAEPTQAPGPPEAAQSTAEPGPRIFQPGAPGQATKEFSTDELNAVEGVTYVEADVRFMQMMIPHHAQALEMTDLVRMHATTDAVRQMALRMEISQRDEIALMQSWLRERGESVEWDGMDGEHGARGTDAAHAGHPMAGEGMAMGDDAQVDSMDVALMPGMLTPRQMEELENARGVEFDRLFLLYMIQHHQGAVDMVADLFMTSGAAQESTVFKFAEDVDADQTMEIARMQRVLEGLPESSNAR
jgi:uncharacterized protein (DUF305 family)